MKTNTCIDDDQMVLYTVEDIQAIFKLGRTRAYQLMAMRGFPAIRLNRKIYVPKKKLEEWIQKNAGRQFNY